MIALWLLTGVLGKSGAEEPEIPAVYYQPGGFYFPPNKAKKRREVIEEAVDEAVEIVTQTVSSESKRPVDPAQIKAFIASIRKAVPQPVTVQRDWQADHAAIMAAIDAEIGRLIEETRKARAEYDDLAWLLLMAA